MKTKKSKVIAIVAVVFSMLLSTFIFYGYQTIYSPNILVKKTDRYVVIPKDATFKDVQNLLYDQDIVQDLVSFSFLAKLMNYDTQVKPGRYLMKADMSNREAIRLLRSGSREEVKVTFNNVRLKEELAEKVTKNLHINSSQLLEAMNNYAEDNTLGFTHETVQSLFIPNTYRMYYMTNAEDVVKRMEQEYNRFWNQERLQKAKTLNMTPVEVSILASIVQAEQLTHPDERRRIAGLYVNRLKQGMKLDSDPTLVYSLGDFTIKRVLNVHKEIESPYNTYKYAGLPPGPINLPDITSLDAVLNYEEHQYIFMCAKEDFSGYHNFATNMSAHLVNARKYQRQLSIEQRKARLKKELNVPG